MNFKQKQLTQCVDGALMMLAHFFKATALLYLDTEIETTAEYRTDIL